MSKRLFVAFFACNILLSTLFITQAEEQIETIVVTTTRSAQALEFLPLSASVISNRTLQLQQADHPSELLSLIPGVNINRGSGAEHLTAIRSPVLTGGAGAGSFLYLQDGIPLRAAGFANSNGMLGTLTEFAEQVEVIRGPAGPSHGANAVHGVVNVITPKPKSGNNTLSLSMDTQQRYKGQGVVSWETPDAQWSSGLSLGKEKGYRKDAGFDQQKGFVRHLTQLDNVEIDTIFHYHNLNQETAGYIFGKETLYDKELRKENAFTSAYRDVSSALLQSNMSYQINNNSILKITPYVRWHQMEFLQHFLPSQAVENNDHWSLGAQSDYIIQNNDWLIHAGIDIDFTKGKLTEFQSIPTVFSYTQGLHYDYQVDASIISSFVQSQYKLNEKLTTIVGARLDYSHYDYQNNTDSGVVGRFLRLDDRSDSFTTFSPKLAFEYQHSDKLLSYVSLARANRPPQTSDLYRLQRNQTQDTADAEQLDAVEIGVRHSISDLLSAQIAVYAMEKQNYFFRDADGNNVNDGKTQHLGFELDLALNLSEVLTLHSALSYGKHTYQFDRNVSRDYEVISKGSDIDTAPRVFANSRLNWAASEKVDVQLQWIKMGSYFTDAANLHDYQGQDTYNLRVNYQLTADSRVTLIVRNLTDKLYAERADYAFGNQRYFPAETRTLALSIRTNL